MQSASAWAIYGLEQGIEKTARPPDPAHTRAQSVPCVAGEGRQPVDTAHTGAHNAGPRPKALMLLQRAAAATALLLAAAPGCAGTPPERTQPSPHDESYVASHSGVCHYYGISAVRSTLRSRGAPVRYPPRESHRLTLLASCCVDRPGTGIGVFMHFPPLPGDPESGLEAWLVSRLLPWRPAEDFSADARIEVRTDTRRTRHAVPLSRDYVAYLAETDYRLGPLSLDALVHLLAPPTGKMSHLSFEADDRHARRTVRGEGAFSPGPEARRFLESCAPETLRDRRRR